MSKDKVKVGIVGGTGYTGVELLRLLCAHPHAELKVITSRSHSGEAVSAMFPSLRGALALNFSMPDAASLQNCDVVFFATPNGTAMKLVPDLIEAGVRVIDLAADFRLQDADAWAKWYGEPHHCPDILARAVYGLPELNREAIKSAQLVANPGCYPTSVTLGLMPLLKKQLVDPAALIADVKSGASGAGRAAQVGTLFCEVNENFKAYKVDGHRHLPEIKQSLAQIQGHEVGLTFVPHLIPMTRGIHATLYSTLSGDLAVDLQALYRDYYQDEPFVDVLDEGVCPETRFVRGQNRCQMAIARPQQGRTVVVLSVIDNLVKGAAGQAVQNMNIMFGFEEAAGLNFIAVNP